MSHDPHIAAHAPTPSMEGAEHPPLPVTAGITWGVKLLIVGATVLSILQGLFVGLQSPFGKVWPAADSTKIQLPPKTF